MSQKDSMERLFGKLGVSYEPAAAPTHIPQVEAIQPGTYSAMSSFLMVEVVSHSADGKVTIEYTVQDTNTRQCDTISVDLFNLLFKPLPGLTLGKQA